MNSNSKTFPISHPPMSAEEYQAHLHGQIQDLTLHDSEELRQYTAHSRRMEYAAHKSRLRIEENRAKQLLKMTGYEIVVDGNRTYMICPGVANGRYDKIELFRCRIERVLRFKYFETEEYFFQLIIAESDSFSKNETELYPDKFLSSLSKLKQTILTKYDCAPAGKPKQMAWEWLYKEIIALYSVEEPVVIPFRPGWFKQDGSQHFYSGTDENAWLFSKHINKFKLERFDEQDMGDIAKQIFLNLRDSAVIQIGVLLLYRFAALFSRLATDDPFPVGITLIGENSEKVARSFLCVLENDVDLVNLDTDRISSIRERVMTLRDTPILFLSTSPENPSTRNRLREIMSWMDTGLVEGTRIRIPFVFCLKKFSWHYPLDRTIVLDVDDLKFLEGKRPFAKLQSVVISLVEKSGEYWTGELQRSFNHFSRARLNGETEFPLFDTVESVLLEMFKSRTQSDIYGAMHRVFAAGKGEIVRQRSLKGGVLADVFRNAVFKMVDENQLLVIERKQAGQLKQAIFYDADFYYVTKCVFNTICEVSKIDEKSKLCIKQRLCEVGMVKLYRSAGSYSREFQVDFRVTTKDGRTEDLSGLAIFRDFWDEIGGVCLFERGADAVCLK